MAFNRRQALGLLGGALASPYVLKSADAEPAVQYVKIGSCYGAGVFDTLPGCDATLHIGGFRVTWVNGGPGDPSFAYSRGFDINGNPASPVTQLGRPSGPTDGTNANLVTCQSRAHGSGVNFFSAPQIGVEDERDIWSNRFSVSSGEIGAPAQVSNPTVSGDYIQGLFSTTLSNGNLATAYTYFDNASEVDARVRICDLNGLPLFHERIFSDPDSFQFANNLVAGPNALFLGYTRNATDGITHKAVRLTFAGVEPHPFELKPPAGQFINGTPSLLPGPNGDLYTLFMAGTVGKDNFDLCLQHFDNKGKRGRIVKVGSQETDNFGLIGNYPRCTTTPKGNFLAFSDAPEEIVAWHFLKTGKLLSRKAFRRRRNRRMRMQQLRRIGATFLALWIETNLANNASQWFAESFNLLNE